MGLLAVALGAAVFVAGPVIARAQEVPQLPPQYYQDLEAYLASPEAGGDTSVPISPEELGLDPQGESEGEGEASSPTAPLSLFSAESLSTPAPSSIYDFALQFVSINGNVPTVPGCDRNPSGAPRSFFDNFDDGEVNTGCTAEFQKFGTFEEFDDLLHMRSENGYRAGGGINHNLVYKTTFKNGQGNFFAGAGFRPDVPQPLPLLFSSYSLHLFDAPPSPILPSFLSPNVNIHRLTLSDGRSIISAGRVDESGTVFRSVLVNPIGQVSILFGFSVNDATNTATPFYSFDFGQTTFVWRNPDGSTFTAPLFTKYDEARLMAAAFVREPEAPLYTQVRSPYPSEALTDEWDGLRYGTGNYADCFDSQTGFSTIRRCGCAIASMVMLGRYYNINDGINNSNVDPGNINAWLTAHNGYTNTGKLWWGKAVEYLGFIDQTTGRTMVRFDFNDRTDWNVPFGSSRIDDFLKSAQPLVAYKSSFGHYLIVDGGRVAGSYRVKDPRWYNTKTSNDAEDLSREVRGYNGSFDTANFFTYLEAPKLASASMRIAIASPAELLVTDPQGRRIGRDPITNTVYDEVPDGIYAKEGPIASSDVPLDPATIHETKVVAIPTPLDGSYNIQVIGTASGSYALESLLYDQSGQSEASIVEGNTATGNVQDFDMDYSPQSVGETALFRTVRIDIKPGSDPNSINLKSRGVVSVAILSDSFFDATNVVVDSVLFAGAKPLKGRLEDADNDGDVDLILHFNTQSLQLSSTDTEGVLTGHLVNGILIKGRDSVRMVSSR